MAQNAMRPSGYLYLKLKLEVPSREFQTVSLLRMLVPNVDLHGCKKW